MKLLLVSLLLLLLSLSSCKSEYEERLEQARELRARLVMVESTDLMNKKSDLSKEVQLLQREIHFLAKVSGNEKRFLEEVYND